MAKIIITRKKKGAGSLQSHDVYLLNDFVGELKNGGSLEIEVDIGTHMLTFKSKLKKLGSDTVFTAVVNNPDEVVTLNAGFNFMKNQDNFEVSYADNKPHILVDKNNDGDVQNQATENKSVSQKKTGFGCPHCGSNDLQTISETTSKGKDFKADNACCGWMLCGPIGLLCGTLGKGKQINTTTYWVCKNCGNKFKV